MNKAKKILMNARVIILAISLVMAVFAISPNPWSDGVAIRNIEKNSSAALAGITSPSPQSTLMSKERITMINNQPVHDLAGYAEIVKDIKPNKSVTIKTTKGLYVLHTAQTADFGMSVYEAPKTNIRKGLDLQGGTRVLLQPEEKLTQNDMSTLIDSMRQRLNIFGLSDVVIKESSDLSRNRYILVEVAGVNEEEVKELLAKQGKFEAKIGNETVFKGGKDITYVCRSAECSGLDPEIGCRQLETSWMCRFRFSITLSQEAAERQANATKKLAVVKEQAEEFLNKPLDLYLDDVLVDSLSISADLKGRAETSISISGSGSGPDRNSAIQDAQKGMKQLQTVLITGSLPVKLNIIKTDTLSPSLGREFLANAMLISIISIIAVTSVVIIRYRKIKIAIPIIIVITSEILLILGVAALLKQNLDIAGIAGIIVAIGTGVDDQIVITDEILGHGKDEDRNYLSWGQKIKKAFFIVIVAAATTSAALAPLILFSSYGFGKLAGFAITEILGIMVGVLISRPAFSIIAEQILKASKR